MKERIMKQVNNVKSKKSLKAQLQKTAENAHGGGKTVHQRRLMVSRFGDYLKLENIQISSISQIKEKYIQGYIQARLNQQIGKRTLQNEMAAIRQTLRAEGRMKLANSPRISNKALGLSGTSRKGTRVAITERQYKQIHQKALLKSPALVAAIELARVFGLRGEEAVQSVHSLKTWQTALENGNTKIRVVYGTKGGRPRDTLILDRERARNAVNTAIQIAEQQKGKLIDKPNLKEAMTYWRNHTRAIGLKWQLSPHSLRYAFAQEAIKYYQTQGYTQQEALAQASMDLGHGDDRGKYVKYVYSNEENAYHFNDKDTYCW